MRHFTCPVPALAPKRGERGVFFTCCFAFFPVLVFNSRCWEGAH